MSNEIVTAEFRDFGRRMNIILICYILNFIIPVIPGIIMFIYSLMVLGNIKRVNEQLNSPNLRKFRSYYITSVVLSIVTGIVTILVMIPFLMPLIEYAMEMDPADPMPDINAFFDLIYPIIIIGIIGFIIILSASILQMQAWDNLNAFFRLNSNLFPDNIAQDAIEGSKNLKTANLCMILIFLIITGIIAIIYMILGYSKLSRLNNLGVSPYKPAAQPAAPAQQAADKRYCSSCGSPVKEEENFCNSCGERL